VDEEIPEAYKDVVDVVHGAGIAKKGGETETFGGD